MFIVHRLRALADALPQSCVGIQPHYFTCERFGGFGGQVAGAVHQVHTFRANSRAHYRQAKRQRLRYFALYAGGNLELLSGTISL